MGQSVTCLELGSIYPTACLTSPLGGLHFTSEETVLTIFPPLKQAISHGLFSLESPPAFPGQEHPRCPWQGSYYVLIKPQFLFCSILQLFFFKIFSSCRSPVQPLQCKLYPLSSARASYVTDAPSSCLSCPSLCNTLAGVLVVPSTSDEVTLCPNPSTASCFS